MRRSVYVYGGVLAGLLVLAGLRWGGLLGTESEPGDTSVVLLKAELGDIEKVVYHDEKQDVLLEPRTDDLGTWVWVTLEERKEKLRKPEAIPPAAEGPEAVPEAAEAATAPAEPPVEVEVTTTHFKGGEAGDTLLASMAPFKAIRRLEGLTPERLAALDLDAPQAWLEITRKGKVHRFDLGGEAYGTKDRYLRDADGSVFLVDEESVRPLRFARSRLPDRRLSPFEEQDLASVRVESHDGRSVTMARQNRDDRDKAYWAAPDAPDRKVSAYSNWLDKALRLKGLSNVEPGEEPQALETAFRMTLEAEKEKPVTIEILRVQQEGGGWEWYARSGFTRSLLKLARTQAAEAAEDVPDVITAEPTDEEEADEEPAPPPAPPAGLPSGPTPFRPPPVPAGPPQLPTAEPGSSPAPTR